HADLLPRQPPAGVVAPAFAMEHDGAGDVRVRAFDLVLQQAVAGVPLEARHGAVRQLALRDAAEAVVDNGLRLAAGRGDRAHAAGRVIGEGGDERGDSRRLDLLAHDEAAGVV